MVIVALLLALVHDIIVFLHNLSVDFNKFLSYLSGQIIRLVDHLEQQK